MEYYETVDLDREGHRLSRFARRPALPSRPAGSGEPAYERGQATGISRAARWATALAVLLVLNAGCVTMGSLIPCEDKPPTGDVYNVVAAWNNAVVFTPDPTHNGDPTPGIAGRVYLFGPKVCYPLAGEGSLVVDMYLDPPGTMAPIAGAKPVERWEIDKDTLQRLLRKDAIGWGYTVFLPWGTYRKDITQVRLRVRYQPVKGSPLYAETPRLTLSDDNTLPQVLPTQVKRPPLPAGRSALAQKP